MIIMEAPHHNKSQVSSDFVVNIFHLNVIFQAEKKLQMLTVLSSDL